jgi:uncharacterized protein
MKTALITGASSGIGLELAKIFAKNGHDLVLVARRLDKLDALKTELEAKNAVNIITIKKDLSAISSSKELYEELKSKNISVDILINNAGFGDFGDFVNCNWEKQEEMLNLNIVALTYLTRLFLPEMVKNGYGKIMNVASTAAFQPGPTMAVYFATKAYVLSFSEAIATELSGTGVTVTALCPGPTKSEFQDKAAMNENDMFNSSSIPTSEVVAAFGYKKMMKGDTIAVHGFINNVLVQVNRITPRILVRIIVKWMLKKS